MPTSKQIARFLKDKFPHGTPQTRNVSYLAGNKKLITEQRPVLIRKTRIFWGTPCDEVSFTRFWIRFVQFANYMPWDDSAYSEGTYLPDARNFVHNAFLLSDLLYLMMMDSDILFPPNIVDTLIAHNKPIIGGWYKDKKADDHHPCVYDLKGENDGVPYWTHRKEPGTGVEKVDGMGAGCWLMKREVAEALGENPYDTIKGGEDLKLSYKLMKLGIPLYVDWSLNLAHCGVFFI